MRFTTLVALLLALPVLALASWSHDPNFPDIVAAGTSPDPVLETSAPDGSGGMIVTWRVGGLAGPVYYAQRYDADGIALWAEGGVVAFDLGEYDLNRIEFLADDAGGLVVAVQRDLSGAAYEPRVRVQWIDAQGDRLFADGGIDPSPGADAAFEGEPRLARWGEDVAVVWEDRRDGNADIYLQRFDRSGNLFFGDDGVPITSDPNDQTLPSVAVNQDEACVIFMDYRAGTSDIYAQRVTAEGTLDGPNFAVLSSSLTDTDAQIVPTYSGVYFVVAVRYAAPEWTINVQRIADWGPTFGSAGLTIRSDTQQAVLNHVEPDGAGGVIAVWNDYRNDGYPGGEVYAQRLDFGGQPLWGVDGMAVEPDDYDQGYYGSAVAIDGSGGAAIFFTTYPYGSNKVRAQYVTADGTRYWPGGRDVTGAYGYVLFFRGGAAWDLRGGFLLGLEEYPNTAGVITRRRLDREGYLGTPAARITAVTDLPQDQGGQVRVDWDRSYLDSFAEGFGVPEYWVWRRYGGPAEAPAAARAATDLATSATRAAAAGVPAEFADLQLDAGWSWVDAVPAIGLSAYAYEAPTYADSTDAGVILTDYMIVAPVYGGRYLYSQPTSGYSVDNLAPGAPLQLAGAAVEADVALTWQPAGVDDEDLHFYRIFRGDTAGFPLEAGSLVGTATDTVYVDPGAANATWYYRVAGVDVHGNEGGPSNEVEVSAVVAAPLPPAAVAWHGAAPNPFNPRTELTFSLPHRQDVSLRLYDQRGRLVRTLVSRPLPAGRHAIRWDGRHDDGRGVSAGVYLAVFQADGSRVVDKLTLVK